MRAVLRYVLSFVLVFAAAALGSFFTIPQLSTWYATLTLPSFTPPSWIFAPVWTILYIFMAVALARVWGRKGSGARRSWIFVFGLQLLLNVLWSLLFFAFHALLLSVVDIVVLWFAVVILTLKSYDLDRISFWLLIPYFAWITFAMILCVGIWWIN